MLELVGRRDSDWAGDSATRQSVAGYHCNVQGVQTARSLSSCEAEFHAASACAGELLGLVELFKELHFTSTFLFVLKWSQIRHVTFYSEEDPEDSSALEYDACQNNNGSEKNVYRLDAWIRKTTQQISSRNFWMDRERGRFQGNLGCMRLEVRTTESFVNNGSSGAGGVRIFSFNSCHNVHYVDTDLCAPTLFSFFPPSACSQSDTDLLYNTQKILRALTYGSKQASSQVISTPSLEETKCIHTFILQSYMVAEPVL